MNRAIKVFDKFHLIYRSYCRQEIQLDHVAHIAKVINEKNENQVYQALLKHNSSSKLKEWIALNDNGTMGPKRSKLIPISIPVKEFSTHKEHQNPVSHPRMTNDKQLRHTNNFGNEVSSQQSNKEITPKLRKELAYRLSITLNLLQKKKLDRVLEILSNSNSELTIEIAIDQALDSLLDKKDPIRKTQRKEKRLPQKKKPTKVMVRKAIPSNIRQAVLKRDNFKCSYVSPEGQHCGCTRHLHIDHKIPVCRGGSNDLSNLRVYCSNHNQLVADEILGKAFMKKKRQTKLQFYNTSETPI